MLAVLSSAPRNPLANFPPCLVQPPLAEPLRESSLIIYFGTAQRLMFLHCVKRAIYLACLLRFRPIIMTTMAAVLRCMTAIVSDLRSTEATGARTGVS